MRTNVKEFITQYCCEKARSYYFCEKTTGINSVHLTRKIIEKVIESGEFEEIASYDIDRCDMLSVMQYINEIAREVREEEEKKLKAQD